MKIGSSLYIKYGLQHTPDEQQTELWVQIVEMLVLSGVSMEDAGAQAAKQIFPDYNSVFYASEADSIEALLAAARKRGGKTGAG